MISIPKTVDLASQNMTSILIMISARNSICIEIEIQELDQHIGYQKILDLGLSHEENLAEARKLKTPHLISVVSLQLTNARDEKIQANIDEVESNKYADGVIISGQNSKFIATEISEELNNGVLDTDIDFLRYNLVGTKDINSENLNHKITHS